MDAFSGILIGLYQLVFLGVIIYVITLVSRLVRAAEKIANNSSLSLRFIQSIEKIADKFESQ